MNKLSTMFLLSSIAVVPMAHANWEWNPLVGVSAGYGSRSGDLTMGTTTPVVAQIVQNHSDNGFLWGLLGGVQARCNNWVFGGELNVDWRNYDDSRNYAFTLSGNSVNTTARFERGTVVGLTVRGGYEMTPYFMPYIRLGAETSDDKVTASGTDGAATFAVDDSRHNYRFVGGLGVEMPIPAIHGLSVRAEYDYHSKGRSINATGLASDGVTNVFASMKPDEHTGIVSVVWNFL